MALIFLMFLFLGYLTNSSISERMSKVTEQRNLEIASILSRELNDYLQGGARTLERLSKDYGLRSNNQVRVVAKSKFVQELEESSVFERIYFVSNNNDVIIEPVINNIADNLTTEDWYQKACERKSLIWFSSKNTFSDENINLSLAVPVYDYSNKLMGVLGADFSKESLKNIINWKIGNNGFISLIDKQYNVIVVSDNAEITSGTNLADKINYRNKTESEEKKIGEFKYNNLKYLVSSVPLSVFNGSVLTQIPFNEAYELREQIQGQLVVFALIILFIIGIALIIVNDHFIIKPLVDITTKMKLIAKGNLKVDLDIKRNDEIGLLVSSFNQMVQQLRNLISGIHNAAESVAKTSLDMKSTFKEVTYASEQINTSMTNVSTGTEDQAQSIDNANKEIYDLAQSLNQLSNTNKKVDQLTEQMNHATEKGQEDIHRVRAQMINIKSAITAVAKGINNFKASSNEIDNILELINSISKQTNLLALNAAIEAARAGQAGQGFSVVADEIRTLAEESTRSSDKIRNLINEIKEEIKESSARMEQGNKEIMTGEELASSASNSFLQIQETIEDLIEGLATSHKAVEESTRNSNMIVQNVENIAGISEETSASAEEVAVASQEQASHIQEISTLADSLSNMAYELEKLVKEFDL